MCRKIVLLQRHLCFCPTEGPFSSETPPELPLSEINFCPSAPRHRGKVQDSSNSKPNAWRERALKGTVCVCVCFSLGSFVSINSWISYRWLKCWTFHIKSRYLAFLWGVGEPDSQNTELVLPNGNTETEPRHPLHGMHVPSGFPQNPISLSPENTVVVPDARCHRNCDVVFQL